MRKGGQIWVETVIYTLIGLAIIGLVLAGALPKINAKRDEMTIGKSIEAMVNIDDKVYEVSKAAGNRRVINLDIRSGALVIDPAADTISWILDSSFEYSEPGAVIPFGRINVTTTKVGGEYKVELKMGYEVDLRNDGEQVSQRRFDIAPTPYRIIIENTGIESSKIVVEFAEA